MTVTDVLGQLAAGFRLALVLFAIMSLLTRLDPIDLYDRLKSWAWMLLALAVVFFSPLHAAALLGRSAPEWLVRLGDVLASAISCVTFILLLAARAVKRGLSPGRVVRGAVVNVLVAVATIAAAWVTR